MSELLTANLATSTVSAFVSYGINASLDHLGKLISNTKTAPEDKELFIKLRDTLEQHQKLVSQLEDSDFVRKRNLSLWLYDKLHEIKLLTGAKPVYQMLLTHIFKSNEKFNNKKFQLEFLAFFKIHFLGYLKHNLTDENICVTAHKSFIHKTLYHDIFLQLQNDLYIQELSADTHERKDFILETFKKFQQFYV